MGRTRQSILIYSLTINKRNFNPNDNYRVRNLPILRLDNKMLQMIDLTVEMTRLGLENHRKGLGDKRRETANE